MPAFGRRKTIAFVSITLCILFLYSFRRLDSYDPRLSFDDGVRDATSGPTRAPTRAPALNTKWTKLKTKYPVKDLRPLPTGQPSALPKVQAEFGPESDSDRDLRLKRRDAVKASFQRCWKSYRKLAWMSDELKPVSGGRHDPFGGWGATLVDSLDTLWIMGLMDEFEEAVAASSTINFDKVSSQDINVFETNIRYLGGFLAAYDLSGDVRLLTKAREVGEMLYVAFDTPNRMPLTRWNAWAAGWGRAQVADDHVLLAEIGTFSLEFIRLSMLTGDPKWYDAVQRIIDLLHKQQQTTGLPGMWPIVVNARRAEFNQHHDYTLGSMADSLYEYLPKTHALVGGLLPVYREMYEAAMHTAIKHNLYRPMLPDEKDVLMSGLVTVKTEDGKTTRRLRPEGQHLVCYAGGMLALGGRLVGNKTHVEKGEKLMDGCIWTYQNMPLGIMPETFQMLPCESADDCPWDEDKWREAVLSRGGLDRKTDPDDADEAILRKGIPKGFVAIGDKRYMLRPEAIESVFILYRITGRKDLLESAWKMYEAIEENTRTPLANSAIWDVTAAEGTPELSDSMESFWLGETLKYFYLMFSEPELISLDEYVFNTEAHPLKRLLP
ncbi:glycoside hydrolase family 47 protein [Thermothelomyces thermophilus ATCC 42464]|uniref:alpha-1,2-Mannosidase n=1 Tax=Thermothelomyces thermophilus (strain ATCC 42464 / BCRC 31852 / DSM 1799) TaxID=573729 RepID=G2QA33_THET4|nr:glycoside hydrolase family 47 protein [Thermothelomyces thermophilus ATCC 42464]AEO56637.1 glycoside hydrolase family 47 protein [Thermothelomyces thermophilus ATCC 42464]